MQLIIANMLSEGKGKSYEVWNGISHSNGVPTG